ncbi:hypothetical protein JW998_00180 [candidate division KSB1 bacterium]|nr:hypothetical protein [candidate division KSB1 bacterium]
MVCLYFHEKKLYFCDWIGRAAVLYLLLPFNCRRFWQTRDASDSKKERA